MARPIRLESTQTFTHEIVNDKLNEENDFAARGTTVRDYGTSRLFTFLFLSGSMWTGGASPLLRFDFNGGEVGSVSMSTVDRLNDELDSFLN